MEKALDVGAIARAMPHRRAVRAPELRRDARAETHLGRLRLNGNIAEHEYEAGVKLRDVVRRWHSACGMPRHDRGAPPLDGSMRGAMSLIDAERTHRVTRAYLDAWAALCNRVGPSGAQLAINLCVYDESSNLSVLDVYRMALKGLADLWAYRRP